MAAQESLWEAGSQSGCHAITQGFLIGEALRRVTAKSFGTYFKEEIAEKIGADFHVGVDPKDFERIADLVEAKETADIMEMDPDSIPGRVFSGLDIRAEKSTSSSGWRQAEIPKALTWPSRFLTRYKVIARKKRNYFRT